MESRVEKALENHKKGCNCAQAVFCAYSDLFGVDEQIAFRMAEGFGGGMGGMHDGTCGAVTAMYMLAGIKESSGTVEKGLTKAQTYAKVRELSKAFQEMNKSTICSDLLGHGDPLIKRSCTGCIEDASRIVEKILLAGEED
ncbi:C-GCAxxG-C-C family protein [Oscillospiraceae bacterium PP1C4]